MRSMKQRLMRRKFNLKKAESKIGEEFKINKISFRKAAWLMITLMIIRMLRPSYLMLRSTYLMRLNRMSNLQSTQKSNQETLQVWIMAPKLNKARMTSNLIKSEEKKTDTIIIVF